jgi:hypothetical protein
VVFPQDQSAPSLRARKSLSGKIRAGYPVCVHLLHRCGSSGTDERDVTGRKCYCAERQKVLEPSVLGAFPA